MSNYPRKMKYVNLGSSGLKVSRIILGAMSYGSTDWMPWLLDEEEGIKQIKYAYDQGINAFDTANVYSNGGSERILGKAIKQHNLPRDEIVILTKVCGVVCREPGTMLTPGPAADEQGYVNQYGLSRKHIFDSVKHSLERLQLDYIDVLQCHRFDPDTPVAETMQALHDVVKAGYVRYIGWSNLRAWQFHVLQNYAITHNLTPFISLQNHYNPVYREDDREIFPTLKHFGVGHIPWSPLARGLVTRPWGGETTRGGGDFLLEQYTKFPATKVIVDRVEEVAKKKGITMAQLALAWLLSKDVIAAPVIGTTSIAKLQALIDAVDFKLTEEEIKYLDEPYQPQPIFMFS